MGGDQCSSMRKEAQMCLHTGTFCVNVCIVFVLSIKYSMYNKTFYLKLCHCCHYVADAVTAT